MSAARTSTWWSAKAAERLQSVNTLVHRPDGTLYGDNTDLFGFLYMVRRSGIDSAGKKALGVSCRSELDLISKLSESQDALYDRIQQLIRELTAEPPAQPAAYDMDSLQLD